MPFWRRLFSLIKLLLAGLLLVYCLMLLVNNAQQQASVWFWPGRQETMSLVYLSLFCFFAGALVMLLTGATLWTYLSMRWKRARKLQESQDRRISETQRKASMLQTKPVRIVQPVPEPIHVQESPTTVDQARSDSVL